MKNKIKSIIFLIALLSITLIFPNMSNAQTRTVTDEETLINAINEADYGDTISIQNNITVTKPIVIAKELIIDGNGYTITGSSDWTSTSGNQTMFTAQLSDANLTLKNIKLENGPKYGVQAYDGAAVYLDNVSITGFKYGGVLVNGGRLEVIDLHLGYNGTDANNGIEIDKGAAATNHPTLVMNGTLTSDTNENVVRVADNGHLTEFTITNTSNTTNKVAISGDSLVLTDENNNVIAETKVPDTITSNTDVQNVIITLVANGKTNKIVAESGKTISEDTLKSHIQLETNQVIDGFFTDEQYTTAFDFNQTLSADTTIYAKISMVETPVPEEPTQPETEIPVKDETPKTGIENYTGLAVLTILLSTTTLIFMRKKRKYRIG